MASVQLLSDSVAKTLDDTASGEGDERQRDRAERVNGRTGNDEHIAEESALQSIDLEAFDPSILDFDAPFSSSSVTGKYQHSFYDLRLIMIDRSINRQWYLVRTHQCLWHKPFLLSDPEYLES